MMGLTLALEAWALTRKGGSTKTGELNKDFATYFRSARLNERELTGDRGALSKGKLYQD